MLRVFILGVPVDAVSQEDVILKIAKWCRGQDQHHIATPNPEMLVEAQKNSAFRDVLKNTDLNIPDGAGLVWAMRRKQEKTIHRITGTDTIIRICSSESRLCPPERIFLLGATTGIAEKAAEELMKKNPAIKEIGTYSGSPNSKNEEENIKRINAFGPTLLFVAYGAPAQDLWIHRNLSKMPTVRVAMGIGGALDFIAGKQKRAPSCMRKFGFEWLWRLILEPRRIKRIWRAVVVFPWIILQHSKVKSRKNIDYLTDNKSEKNMDSRVDNVDEKVIDGRVDNVNGFLVEDTVENCNFLVGLKPDECRLKPAAIAQTIHLTLTPHDRYPAFKKHEHALIMINILENVMHRHDILLQETCVMPDHVHLLLAFARGRNINMDVIRKIKGGSAYAFLRAIKNPSHKLWGKKYHFECIDSEEQFKKTMKYIRQNPIRENINPEGRLFSKK